MSRRDNYKTKLTEYFADYFNTGKEESIVDFLTTNSNLPGPRANLELVEAFANTVKLEFFVDLEKTWSLCRKLAQITDLEAPANKAQEFPVLCAARAFGVFGVSPAYHAKTLTLLKQLASDTRWRIREGVAMAIQNMIEDQPQKTLRELEEWIGRDNWLIMRAVAAGVGEPRLLKNKEVARSALELHKKIFEKIVANKKDRQFEGFRTLRQGLGFTLSVVVQADSNDGFEYMRQLVRTGDESILWIVKENLKKNRLIKNFPTDVKSIDEILKNKVKSH